MMVGDAGSDGAGTDEAHPVDPLADLLFTLIAAVLPAILLLAPTLERTRPAPIDAATPAVTLAGRAAEVIVAGGSGLRLTGDTTRVVDLDHISDDAGLNGALERMRATQTPLVLIVEPDGLESAFLLDPVAAVHGPAEIEMVRATATCAATRDRFLSAACRSGTGRNAGP